MSLLSTTCSDTAMPCWARRSSASLRPVTAEPGATLGCFKGRTAGIGLVLGYIQPIGQEEKLLLEFNWLPELDTQNRLKGEYLWLKMVYTF